MEESKRATNRHKTNISLLETVSSEVEANSNLTIKAKVLCVSGCNLQGDKIKIVDLQGEQIAEVELQSAGETVGGVAEFTVQVPKMPGEQTWKIVYFAQQREDTLHEESSVELSFKVRPHRISLSAWEIPSPVNKGEKFRIKIGAKCLAGCSLAGLPIVILDDSKNRVVEGRLGEEVLPQTEGIYWTEQELTAPADEELHKWVVESFLSELEVPHQANTVSFSFRTVKAPEHTVTIEVTNRDDHTPLEAANIMLGLHRAVTDEQGRATLSVPGGRQKLYVAKDDYLSIEKELDITEDTTVKIEMEFFPCL